MWRRGEHWASPTADLHVSAKVFPALDKAITTLSEDYATNQRRSRKTAMKLGSTGSGTARLSVGLKITVAGDSEERVLGDLSTGSPKVHTRPTAEMAGAFSLVCSSQPSDWRVVFRVANDLP